MPFLFSKDDESKPNSSTFGNYTPKSLISVRKSHLVDSFPGKAVTRRSITVDMAKSKQKKKKKMSSVAAPKKPRKTKKKKSKSKSKKLKRYSSYVIDKQGKVVLRDLLLHKNVKVGCRQILRLVNKNVLLRLINKRKTRF